MPSARALSTRRALAIVHRPESEMRRERSEIAIRLAQSRIELLDKRERVIIETLRWIYRCDGIGGLFCYNGNGNGSGNGNGTTNDQRTNDETETTYKGIETK